MMIKKCNQLIRLETYAHGMSKDLICKKEKIKWISIIKKIQKCITLIILKKKA